jgi:D-tyrosyl-tRNA(Tyr) deacylase
MRVLIQRVKEASVTVDSEVISLIHNGLLVFVGITDEDNREDILWLTKKIANIRLFDDENGVMNLSVMEAGGDILAVSQFTLMASTKKGNRPSYIKAAKPEISVPLYEEFCSEMELAVNKPIQRGVFGADMKVRLLNDGPVTIFIDSKNRE